MHYLYVPTTACRVLIVHKNCLQIYIIIQFKGGGGFQGQKSWKHDFKITGDQKGIYLNMKQAQNMKIDSSKRINFVSLKNYDIWPIYGPKSL